MGTFGQALRDAREDLGVSLAEAERETRISRRYLEALETEDDSAMPPAVYTRGFIRTYCQYLGLNPDAMLDLFGPRQAIEDNVEIRPIPAEVNAPRVISFRPAVVLAGLIVASLLVVYLWGQYTSFLENVDRIDTAPTSRAPTCQRRPAERRHLRRPRDQRSRRWPARRPVPQHPWYRRRAWSSMQGWSTGPGWRSGWTVGR